MMAELLYGPTLWNRIRAQSAAVRRRKAAVAYVGKDAEELVSFASGDVVIFDGSRSALKTGATNPDTIGSWLNAGAALYSYEGLHAKVLVLGHTVVVGSANLSWHSHDQLMEAAVVDTSASLRQSAVAMIDELVASSLEPVDAKWVQSARALYRPPRGPQTGARAGTAGRPLLPPGPFRLLIGQWEDWTRWSSGEARRDEETRALLKSQRGPARQYELTTWAMDGDDFGVRDGDVWLLVSFDDQQRPVEVSSPGRVLRVRDLSRSRKAAYLRHDLHLPPKPFADVHEAVHAAGGRWTYERNLTDRRVRAALLALWGLKE